MKYCIPCIVLLIVLTSSQKLLCQTCLPCCCLSTTTTSISGDQIACGDENILITATSSDPLSDFVWSTTDSDSNTSSSDINVLVTSTTIYSVTITDSNGCEFMRSLTINHYLLPDPPLTNYSICESPPDLPGNWSGACTDNTTPNCTVNLNTIFGTPVGVWTGNGITSGGLWNMSSFATATYNFTITVATGCFENYSIDIIESVPFQMLDFCNDDTQVLNGFTTFGVPGGFIVTDPMCNTEPLPVFNSIDISTLSQGTYVWQIENPNSSSDDCNNCVTYVGIDISQEPNAILTFNDLDFCEACTDIPSFNLNFIVSGSSDPGQWYLGDRTLSCDGTGTPINSTISPAYGYSTYTYMSQGTGNCTSSYDCELVQVYNSPDLQNFLEVEFAATYDFCDCPSNPSIDIVIVDTSPGEDCLIEAVALDGTNGFFYIPNWSSLGLGETQSPDGLTLSIPCANLPNGLTTVDLNWTNGNTNTSTCTDIDLPIDINVNSCCEDCLFSLEARNEPNDGHLAYDECQVIQTGGGLKRLQYLVDVTLIQDCPASGITETVIENEELFINGLYTLCVSTTIIASMDEVEFINYGLYSVPDPNNSSSTIASYLNTDNPGAGYVAPATFFASGGLVCFEISVNNTDGWDTGQIGLNIFSAFSTANDFDYTVPGGCGVVDVEYSDNTNDPDVGYFDSGADIEVQYDDIIIHDCTTLNVNLVGQTTKTCEVCP